MTIYAPPDQIFTATLSGAPTGLVGTLAARVRNTDTLVDVVARSTSGIVEVVAGSGIYSAEITAPTDGAGPYAVIWDDTVTFTSEDLVVTYSLPPAATGPVYVTLEQLKSTLAMTGTTFADADVTLAAGAASRAVDTITGRRFWLDADANQVRYYTPRSIRLLQIDDLVAMTSVKIDRSGNGNFSETWTLGTDYVLEPFNAPSERPARPYETLRPRVLSSRWFPTYIEQSVKVTGQFGWAAVPDDVTAATGILAAKLLRRSREAPFGIVMAGIDSGVAMRIARTDPDVYTLLHDYTRHEPFV